jgi:type II secretory pathway predicted ATPase ExeA
MQERGIGLVTGEVGSGKTVAIRAAVSELDAASHTIIYIGNPSIGAIGIYANIVNALGGNPRFRKGDLIAQTMELLDAEEAEKGRTSVLIIDEAHLLDRAQFEEVRMLTNSEMDSHSQLAVILAGQPTLRRHIKLGTFAALDQRITVRTVVSGMTVDETKSYLDHRVKIAGRSDSLFSDAAVEIVHQGARGMPRAVNNIAQNALLVSFLDKQPIVGPEIARKAVAETNAE